MLALLLSTALAATVQLPPGEDAAAWQAAAAAAQVDLVTENPDLLLLHEGDDWALVRLHDPASRLPIPAPWTPERRAAVLALAAHILAEPAPPPGPAVLALPAERARETLPIEHTPEQAVSPAREAELLAEADPPPPPPPAIPDLPPPPAERWVAGVELGGILGLSDPHPYVAISGGRRFSPQVMVELVGEAGLAVPIQGADEGVGAHVSEATTVERGSLRLEGGAFGIIAGVGLGRAQIVADQRLRGDLLYPVVALGFEHLVPIGRMWLVPRFSVGWTAAAVTLTSDAGTSELGQGSVALGIRMESQTGTLPW